MRLKKKTRDNGLQNINLHLDVYMGKEPQAGVEVFQILNDLSRPKVSPWADKKQLSLC